jgi:hypothetical protein
MSGEECAERTKRSSLMSGVSPIRPKPRDWRRLVRDHQQRSLRAFASLSRPWQARVPLRTLLWPEAVRNSLPDAWCVLGSLEP